VVSLRITGRKLDRLRVHAGQFFVWRFLDGKRWRSAHPFSLSAAPDGHSLRITVKALGDHTARLAELRPGTRVFAEGPFGVFTARARHQEKAVLIAGGIGITPVRALLETMPGDVVVIYRAIAEQDVIFRDELDSIAAGRGAIVHYVLGDHRGNGADLLSPAHLKELLPDIEQRDVFLCGPLAMTQVLEQNVRGARVPRRHIHTERFALT
jgi:ferredoxin-NADP reductase